jgi:hypothetical protein
MSQSGGHESEKRVIDKGLMSWNQGNYVSMVRKGKRCDANVK